MKDHFTKEKIMGFFTAAAVTAVAGILAVLDVYKCPLDYLFGIPCPMCGITRAFIAALQGDFAASFYYHPLWPLFIIVIVAYILYYFGFIRISDKTFRIFAALFIISIVVCFIYRHITASPVVRIHPDNCFFSGIFN